MGSKYKNSLLAVLWSILCPGFGQIYLGKIKRGFVFFLISLVIKIPEMLYFINPNTKGFLSFFTIFSLLFYLYAAVDSFRIGNQSDASTSNKRTLTLFILYVFLGLGFAIYIRQNVVQPFKVPSAAMSPTIIEGDHIFADKMIYKKAGPQRGDVVVFIFPKDRKKDFIKRIVGLPNETIAIKDGVILINGVSLTQPDVFKRIYYYNRGQFCSEGQQIKIPENHYFVLGDNSASSYDSRYWGFVPRENIIGKAFKIFFPFNRSRPI